MASPPSASVAGEGLRVVDDVLGIVAERGPEGLAQRNRLGRDHVHQRPALDAGEDRRVDLLADLVVHREDHAAARAAQRLVRGGGDDVRVRQRARVHLAGDQPGEMRHVDHQIGADRIRDLAELREVDDARIGGPAGDDDLRLVLGGEARNLVEIDARVLAPHAVLHGVEPLARIVGRGTVGQMPAGGERHAHDGVAGLGEREERAEVGLGAGMGLGVDEGAVEQLLRPLARQILDHVHIFAAAVIAPARIALGVFVGHHRALGLEHRGGDQVLRGDQLDLVLLTRKLAPDRGLDLGVRLAERGVEKPAPNRRRGLL